MPKFDTVHSRLSQSFLELAPLDIWEEEILPDLWNEAVERHEERWKMDLDVDLDYEREVKTGYSRVYRMELPKQMRDRFAENPAELVLSLEDIDILDDELEFIVGVQGDFDKQLVGNLLTQFDAYSDYSKDEISRYHFQVPIGDIMDRAEKIEGRAAERMESFLEAEDNYYFEKIPYGRLYAEAAREPVTVNEIKEEYGEQLPGKNAVRKHLNDLVKAGVMEKDSMLGSENVYYRN
ncbi:MAG: hypothetical protein ABEJ72_00770 [Candidatus Aenigmatarchaeota archaeon]